MANEKDDLDDLLSSALDELEVDDAEDSQSSADLSNAVKRVADESAKGAKEAEAKAASGGMGDDFDFLKQLSDPEFAKSLEESLAKMNAGEGAEQQQQWGEDEEIAATLKSLAEAAKGLEGADPAQAEELGTKIMEDLMKSFDGMSGKQDFQNMMDGMMKQLMGKEVMYEPLKQMCEKYPEWLAENEPKLDKQEYERYGKQYQYYQRIVDVYESEPDNFGRISELFQELQDLGQPPVELMKDMAPGLDIGADGIPNIPNLGQGNPMAGLNGMGPEGCAQQ